MEKGKGGSEESTGEEGEDGEVHRFVTLSAAGLDVLKSLQACQKKKKKLHSPEMIAKWNF